MEAYIFLIQNGDLYYIGSSRNLEKAQDLFKPGKLCASFKTKESETICKSLQSRYSEVRVPQTDYFRLSKSQLLECQLMMKNEGGKNYFEPIFQGYKLIITFVVAWLALSGIIIKLAVDPILQRIL